MREQRFVFDVDFLGEEGAGLLPFHDEISIHMAGDHQLAEEDFCEIMKQAISEYFDGPRVTLRQEAAADRDAGTGCDPRAPLLIAEIEEVAALPSLLTPRFVHDHPTPTGWHESMLRSYQVLGVVERLLEMEVSPVLIRYLIKYMKEAPCREA